MKIYPTTANPVSRIRVNATLSAAEAEALQKLLKKLTTDDYQKLADSPEEASVFIEAASKMSRQLTAAEQLPVLPAYDD